MYTFAPESLAYQDFCARPFAPSARPESRCLDTMLARPVARWFFFEIVAFRNDKLELSDYDTEFFPIALYFTAFM
jgi:hypothetical protein